MAAKKKKAIVEEEEFEYIDIMEAGIYRPIDKEEGHYIIALGDTMEPKKATTFLFYTMDPGLPPKITGASIYSPWAEQGRKYVRCPHLRFSGTLVLV